MHTKNIFLLGVFLLSSIFATNSTATTLATTTTNPIEQKTSKAEKKKKRSSKFKKWNEQRKLIKELFRGEFIIDDLENVHLIEGCETIRFSNGNDMQVEIISMDDQYVSYKPCDGDDSEEERISLQEVSTIHSASGDLMFKGGTSSKTDSKILTFSIVSIVAAFLGALLPILGIIFGIVSIIYGSLALKKIRLKGGDNTGRGLALGGLIGGIAVTALWTLILIILLAPFFF